MSNFELQGELAGLRQKNMMLDTKANITIRSVKQIFNRAAITCEIEDLDVEGAALLVADLIAIKGEKIRNLGKIKRIEGELS